MFLKKSKESSYVYLLQILFVALFVSGCEVFSPQTKAVIDVSSTRVATGENVIFDGSASSGGEGQIVSYTWKDEASNTVLNETVSFNHVFTQAKKYNISLTVVDQLGKSNKTTVTIDVFEVDITPPVITLNGASPMTLTVGDTYNEPGATATDDKDGNVDVTISGNVDTSKAGTYTITYSATDEAGNKATQTRTVTVAQPADTTPPVISLNGEANVTLTAGDTYTELGATAVDDRDGNVTVDINGTVDTNIVGTYIINYSAKDSAGNTAKVSRVVNVAPKVGDTNVMTERLKEILNDPSVPYTTDADFNQTEYTKHHIEIEKAERTERAHILVATAEDPDPEWFYTKVDKSVIMAKAGEEYVVNLKKMRKDGTVYDPVDNDKLRLVVRVQRSKDEFEYITNVNIDQYARWDGAGVLKIYVPNDLDKGRLIVGIRPNFTDVATSAIAERWSSLVVAEVWQLKQDVVDIDESKVLFPINDATINGISQESKFTLDNIKTEVINYMNDANSTVLLPMVVEDTNLKEGDLVAYMFQDRPYSGKVIFIDTNDNQNFVLLAPTLFDVYDITDADDGFMIKEGLYPENVIIREGERLYSDTNESDPTEFRSIEKISDKSLLKIADYFEKSCSEGDSLLTIKTDFKISPPDASIDLGLFGLSEETKCTWDSDLKGVPLNPAFFAAGGPIGIAMVALGFSGELKPYGKFELATKDALGLGVDMGYSYSQGGHFKLLYPTALGSVDLKDDAQTGTAEASLEGGIKLEFKALDIRVGAGWVLNLLGIDVVNIGAEATSGIKGALVVNAKNASEVKKSGSSEASLNLTGEFGVELTTSLYNWLVYLGASDIKHKISHSINLIDPPIKFLADFNYYNFSDNGQGSASFTVFPTSSLMYLFTPKSYDGVLSIDDTVSSVWNDRVSNISYEVSECEKSSDGTIVTPAIACAGWMCGNVQEKITLCDSGHLFITDVYASARVEQLAKGSATIYNNVADTNITIAGSPLEPKTKTEQMKAGGSLDVEFEKVCPGEPGTYRGKSTVSAEGINLSDEAQNVMVCYDDENKGDPHITTSDGLAYDYFASGDYILSRIPGVSGYEIQARFLPGFQTSWPQAVAVQVGADRVEIQGRLYDEIAATYNFNALSVWVNGNQLFNPSKIVKLPSGGVLAITESKLDVRGNAYPASITIIWPEGSPTENYGLVVNVTEAPTQPFIETLIARPDTYAGQERGLLGNNDGNPKNDFIRRNGEVLGQDHNISFTELYALFGADWLVRSYESLFRNPEAIKPEFPTDIVTLTAEQRALGEQACAALTGFYREACIFDVGLSGSVELVKEYYANTEDLNALSELLVTPDVDMALYTMSVADKVYKPDSAYHLHYTQDINITKISGIGKFTLIVRPPRGATATFSNGDTSYTDEGNKTTQLEVDCTTLNPETNTDLLPLEGAVQLWRQDPLSGALRELISQESLPCTDASKRPKYSLLLGSKEEKADSNDTHQHYTRELMVKHDSVDNGEFFLDITPPQGAIVKLNGSTTELNISASGDYNATIEIDCTNQTEINTNKGSINLWEKDTLTQARVYLYANYTLSCQKLKVLKTGQTTSYYPKDDGDYQAGESRSYTRDDAKEVVIDNATGLMWQDNSDAKTITKLWVTQANYNAGKYNDTSGDTATTYCENLELGGYTDWRLPSRKELVSLSDYGHYYLAIDPIFENVASYDYWSSTTYAYFSSTAWVVNFYRGYQYYGNKDVSDYVRCVRAGQ